MIYYPKANIIPNLYSNGEVAVKGSNQPYIGYFFTTFDGKAYTGREPGDGANIELTIPLSSLYTNEDATNPDYRFIGTNDFYSSNLLNLKRPVRTPILTPTKYYPVPQDSDYQTGEFQRYFSKKINENIYTETRELFQNNLYIGFSIPWLIRGNIDNVAKVNQRIVALKEAELGVLGLGLYLKNNYIQFYK
jgi:hypothetical protein